MSGITLIALVVTIVVLLILAGITITFVLNDGGIFSQAQRSKEQTRIGELLDKFNVSEATVALEKLGKPSLEDFINQVQNKEGYIIEAEKQEEGYYQVTTEDGYVFDVSIIEGTNTNDIIIEYIGQAGNLPPIMKVKDITTNSAVIEVIRIEGITNYKYEYKKHEEQNYQTAVGNNNTCTLTNLTNNTIYDVKVTVTKEGKEIVLEKQIAIGKIPTGGTIKLRSVTWANNKATAVVYHEETKSYKIEWQKSGGATSEAWNSGEMGVKEISIPNLNHGDMVLLRLNDGTSSGDEASISIIDDKNPQQATITFNPETAQTGQNITAAVTLADNESGINLANSKYIFSKSDTPLGTEDVSQYTGGTFASGTSLSIKGTSAGKWYLHVLSVDNAGNMVETVSNAIEITQAEIADLDRSKGDIEIAFVDMSNNPISAGNVPTPKLGTGMTAKKWNGSSWVNATNTAPGGDWYNYGSKQWANAQTEDGSMWVWVPRYSYKILYKNASGNIIGYSNSDGITDANGNIVTGTKKQGAVEVKGSLDGKQIEKYVLHPAFTTNTTNGGWSSELSGIWVAKFEASKNDATASSAGNGSTIKIQPGVQSWRSIPVNDIFNNCKSYNSGLNSHMMKNSEWGACAYLSKSIYGINGEIWINPNSSFVTGQAGSSVSASGTSSTNAYQTSNGVKASTTGNVYGIYDMSGGAWEYVASYVNNSHNYLQTYGASLVNSSSGHLKQVYSKGSSDDRAINYQANKGRYGDAVYETSTKGNSSNSSWYGDYSYIPYTSSPFFFRGGAYGYGSSAGAFCFHYHTGASYSYNGFRPVLAPAV